ncbi:MAG TPA: DUF5668 domain-containing protein [Candidatus Limnocylindrales bacterium]|nr:DUF5668 domain-containing protein [Candidatus Limnocylindrales bacterium]
MTRGRRRGYGGFIAGAVLILVGVAFLLRNAGILDLDWSLLWPLILVAIGIVVIVGAIGAGDRGWEASGGEQRVVVPVDGARRLGLSLRLGAGSYRLAAGTGPELVEVIADQPTIASETSRNGDLALVRLSTAIERWGWGWRNGHTWQIGVARGVPAMLDMQAGAGTFHVDLSALSVVSARFGIGAAELTLVLPRPTGEVPIRIDGGAASFTIAVPAGVHARVSTTGLVATSGPSETPGYASATDRVTVTLTGGAASVRVTQAG